MEQPGDVVKILVNGEVVKEVPIAEGSVTQVLVTFEYPKYPPPVELHQPAPKGWGYKFERLLPRAECGPDPLPRR